jgi:hypothetical protein
MSSTAHQGSIRKMQAAHKDFIRKSDRNWPTAAVAQVRFAPKRCSAESQLFKTLISMVDGHIFPRIVGR